MSEIGDLYGHLFLLGEKSLCDQRHIDKSDTPKSCIATEEEYLFVQ